MRILFVGEASYVHNILQRHLQAMGHDVVLMSDGNAWHQSPRDIDLHRDLRRGKWGGLAVLWTILKALPRLKDFDVVQLTNPNCIPLRQHWNIRILRYLARHNRCMVLGCFGDDPLVIKRQLEGALEYSDIYWQGQPQMQDANAERIRLSQLPEMWRALHNATQLSHRLVACLYEYHRLYDIEPYRQKLTYLPLPIDLPPRETLRPKGQHWPLNVLVGIQRDRDYMKGAWRIAKWLERLAAEQPDRLRLTYIVSAPYDEYCRMLDEADVLVDQLYSYTPAMGALAAMARGTVVIGGGEEEYYRFIGEQTLRPIINVRPDDEEQSIATLREALFTPGRVADLSRQSRQFVERHHDARLVAQQYAQLYETILSTLQQ